jgi:hypothetical protein
MRPDSLPAREHILAEVTVLGVPAGVLEFEVTPVCDVAGNSAELSSRMSTTGVVRFFKATDGSSTTIMDLNKGRPLESELLILDGDVTRRYRARHKPGVLETSYLRTGAAPKNRVERIATGEHPLDMQSAFLLLRHWQTARGARGYFYVLLGKQLWKVSVESKGLQPVDYRGEQRSTIKLEGVARRVQRKEEQNEPRQFSIWFSNDAARTPLRVEGDVSFGKVSMVLSSRRIESWQASACARVVRSF